MYTLEEVEFSVHVGAADNIAYTTRDQRMQHQHHVDIHKRRAKVLPIKTYDSWAVVMFDSLQLDDAVVQIRSLF